MNIFDKATITIKPFLDMTGYEPKTTFWSDFTIAEMCGGVKAIKDTYKRAFEEWKTDYVYLTELVMMLNWKIFEYYETNQELAEVYDSLWRTSDAWCMENLKGEALNYYIKTTD